MKRIFTVLLAAALILSTTINKTIDPATCTFPQIEFEQQETISNENTGGADIFSDDAGSPAPGGDIPN